MTQFFIDQTMQVAEVFADWHNRDCSDNGASRSRYCQLFDAFKERETREQSLLLTRGEGAASFHNCIGCNIEEGCLNIFDFVQEFAGTEKERTYLTIYTLLFYTLAERLAVVYQELGVEKGGHFDWMRFPILRNVKHWANFFKHPKAYMFLHHPGYFLESDPDRPNFLIEGEIDSSFVDLFYRAKNNDAKLRQLFESKKGWNIIFPDLLQLTKDLCDEVDKACEFILKPENVEILRRFTLRGY